MSATLPYMPAPLPPKADPRVPVAASFLTVAEAAAHIGVTKQQLDRLERAGKIHYVRLSPKVVRVSVAEIERLARGEAPSPSAARRST